jgi:hypothetical protein
MAIEVAQFTWGALRRLARLEFIDDYNAVVAQIEYGKSK